MSPALSVVPSLLALALVAHPVAAQVEDVDELDPIVITAARTAQTADEALASVTVVDRAEMDRRQSHTMTDVMRGLPGVDISTNGGLGHNTNIYLRGARPDHTLLLIDGVRIGSASSGFLPWASIPLGLVERVEVVRGPSSSLYGSEAIGGVVQVFTRSGEVGPLRPRLLIGAGSDNRINTQFGVSGGTDTDFGTGWFDAGLGFEQTQGFNVCDGTPDGGGCGVYEFDDDGYRNGNGSLRAGWAFSDRLEIDLNFLRSEGDLEYDGSAFYGNEKRQVLQVLGTRLTAKPLDPWTLTLSAGRSWDDSEIFANGEFINRLDNRRDQLSWQNDIAFAPGQLATIGIDYLRDELSTPTDYDETSRETTGVFGQYLGRLLGQDLQLSLRHDDNEQYGGKTTGDARWGIALENGLRLTAAYGTAFKAPTFNDLYYPGFGNPDLEPETSWSAELGLSGRHVWGEWALNAYQTEVDELIAFDAATYSPMNIDQARIRGLELWATADLSGWLLDGNLTLLDPRNDSEGPNDGNLLPRRAQQTVRLDADRRFGQIDVGATVFVSGRRFDDDENAVRLDGYSLVDLRAAYAFSDALRIEGRIENLFDEDYETAAYFNQPGRTLFLALRYEP
ncbi:TonB-dependent vitamin B12 receptor [Halochromatium glycolicum]|uniref:TonB-dependent vitamin B12 receptor n=1 Tax=Halochromatium glycolicum TaxID=85075 RepID=A0AAJ0U274_9GAMM|nr:TonB-dependent vitamin B12 receptor [Halochromatium glycolicum]MBK1703928.1 TonB-dependent vitamin B12 receptor [Halochromatium glycolicum]